MTAAAVPSPTDLTDRAAFVFWTHDNVRFSDVDRYGHINNIAIATYCETGRVEFAETLWPGATAGSGAGWVIVHLNVTFLAQAHYPGNVEIGTRIERVGRSSCTIGQGLFKDGACFATADSVLVWVDLAGGGTPAAARRRRSRRPWRRGCAAKRPSPRRPRRGTPARPY